jgi:hypothetical protein
MRVLGCRHGLLLFCMGCCGEFGLEYGSVDLNDVTDSISEQQHTVKYLEQQTH